MGCSASQPQEYEVELSVYTLGQKGSIAERAGAYHTGLVVDGVEWAFGGGDGPGTGVWSQEPGRLPPSFGNCAFKELIVLVFPFCGISSLHLSRLCFLRVYSRITLLAASKETIKLGLSKPLTPAQLRSLIQQLAAEWPQRSYSLVTRNCNHFSAALSERLGAQPPPQWINSLANDVGAPLVAVGAAFLGALAAVANKPKPKSEAT